MIVPEEQKKDMLIFSGKQFNEAEKPQSRNILIQFNQENIIDLYFEDSANILHTVSYNNHLMPIFNNFIIYCLAGSRFCKSLIKNWSLLMSHLTNVSKRTT